MKNLLNKNLKEVATETKVKDIVSFACWYFLLDFTIDFFVGIFKAFTTRKK